MNDRPSKSIDSIPLHQDVKADLDRWRGDQRLARLVERFDHAADTSHALNILSEIAIARHLLSHGCDLAVELPTPAGRSSDFSVNCEGLRFFLHIKRLNTGRATVRRLSVSSRLRILERIPRPYIVGIRWRPRAGPRDLNRIVKEAEPFILSARVNDEFIVRDDDGSEIGGCRILAPWNGDRVTLVIGLPEGFVDESPRVQKLLRKAYQQFMPGALNVIMISSDNRENRIDVENALLGSHVERWDLLPPQDRRVAHGRADDGFWSGAHFSESEVAGWYLVSPSAESIEPRLWIRDGASMTDDQQLKLRTLFVPR